MPTEFNIDPHPHRPRILFIGFGESSHTESWIRLLDGAEFNVRLFCLPSGKLPDDWNIKCYTTSGTPYANNLNRIAVYPPGKGSFFGFMHLVQVASDKNIVPGPRIFRALTRMCLNFFIRMFRGKYSASIEEALAKVIQEWKPDIIHTLGFDPASYLYLRCRAQFEIAGVGKWVAQARGGPDLGLQRYDPDYLPNILAVFRHCDHFIADNETNYAYALEAGLDPDKIRYPGMGVVSGAGGIDCDGMTQLFSGPPSKRERIIVWPKAYETYTAKALPVFEALIKVWDRIQPCRIEMLWMVQSDVKIWYEKMVPAHIKRACSTYGRLTLRETWEKISKARVMIAPSLSDGIPNTMMEAMALGTAPLVSPLETIIPVVKDEENVLFARNLYPDEIAEALLRLMSDDDLVDRMAANNMVAIRRMADRIKIKVKAIQFYEQIAQMNRDALYFQSPRDREKFESDEYPGRPRILLITSTESVHTLAWLRMLDGAKFNFRVYCPFVHDAPFDDNSRIRLYAANQQYLTSGPYRKFLWLNPQLPSEPVLRLQISQIIENWAPDVIHTMGFFDAGRFFADARTEYGLEGKGRWLLQTRGGSDLELNRFIPEKAEQIRRAAAEADQILSDNTMNFEYLKAMGVEPRRFSRIGTVPGSGGLDLAKSLQWNTQPASRRTIVWPKAYNTAYTQALPCIEAIRLAWERIKPCRIVMLWVVQNEVKEWLAALPEEIRACCEIHAKISQNEVLEKLREARVMLAPSLVDGTPNSMFEAMAVGAIPIVSPLNSIKSVLGEAGKVLFARNLYPDEIAGALVRAFSEADLVEQYSAANRDFVSRVADREKIAQRVIGLYESMSDKTKSLEQA